MKDFVSKKSQIINFPTNPGVYLFKDEKGVVLYVGKAKNLQNRLSSYFLKDLAPKTSKMVTHSKTISTLEVNSEFEALLLEANLVKKYNPKYNVALKDDKTPLYIAITREKYPRVVTLRKSQLGTIKLKKIFGPFVNSTNAKRVLKLSRRIFTFAQHRPTKKACIYSQIGLCNPCPSIVENEKDKEEQLLLHKKYLKNINNLKKFLSGEFASIKKDLTREMEKFSHEQNFEEAKKVLLKIQAIDYVTTPQTNPESYVENSNLVDEVHEIEAKELQKIISKFLTISTIHRIECFDIAHLYGSNPTASMVTFINGEADKSYYRHFRIKRSKGNSDVDSLKEVFKRRMQHLEDLPADATHQALQAGWGEPDLIIVDGGKPQVSAASEIVKGQIPLVGLAKRFETIVIKTEDGFKEIRLPRGNAKNLVQRIRDEAHRFARRYHHHLVKKQLLGK